MTARYEVAPYEREVEVEVVEVGEVDGSPFVCLADTICYPEGGGQPADRGLLRWNAGTAQIVDVQRVDGRIRHVLSGAPEKLAEPQKVHLELDWARRYDHMQQHTAQHLVTAIAADRHGWPTTSFHLSAHRCDIELEVPRLTSSQLEELEAEVAVEIRAGRPIGSRRVEIAEYERLDVRSRGLPKGHRGSVRLVEIDGLDLNTCGGTHLSSTAEIESLALLGTESMRGGTRLYWVAGSRVRRRLREQEERTTWLKARLEAGPEDWERVLDARADQSKALQKELKEARKRLAELESAALVAAADDELVAAAFPGTDVGFLRAVSRQVLEERPHSLCLLTTARGGNGNFLLARGQSSQRDLRELGGLVTETLEGRGGGSESSFQGVADRLEELSPLADHLRKLLSA